MPSDAIAYDTSVGTDGRVLGVDGKPMGKLMPDDMVMAPGGKIIGWRDKASGAVCILPTGRTRAGDQVADIFREMQVRSRWSPEQIAELFRQVRSNPNYPYPYPNPNPTPTPTPNPNPNPNPNLVLRVQPGRHGVAW